MISKESLVTGAILLLITYTLSLSLVSQAFPAGQATRKLSSSGSIQVQTTTGIGIYSDPSCTNALTSMAWGTLQAGGTQNFICYIKNEGSGSTTLSMQTDSWTPASASNYLELTWNYGGQSINAGSSVQVTFTLSVDPSITGITTFGFDITVIGS